MEGTMKTMLSLLLVLLLFPPIVVSQGRFVRDNSVGVHLSRPARKAPPIVLNKVTAAPLPAGSYTVGVGGAFPTIDSAFRRLETGGITEAVTLLLKDTLYVAPFPPGDFRLIGPIAGAGPASRITLRPADNVAVRIEGRGTATLTFEDVSYLTLDGISLEGSTRLKVHTTVNTFYDWNDAIDLWGDCDHDSVRNVTAGSDRISNLWTSTLCLITKDFSAPDSCVVSGVTITSGSIGVFVGGYPPYNQRPSGNVIRDCHIGSPADSLISQGIVVVAADGTIVENNHVENLRLPLKEAPAVPPSILGINPYFCRDIIVRNNVVHGLRGGDGAGIQGIMASGDWNDAGITGRELQIYNNFIYDLHLAGTDSGYIGGIGVLRNDTVLVAYNTVRIDGTSPAGTGADALAFDKGATNATAMNNILVNVCQGGGNSALWVDSSVTFSSDHNDLYIDTTVTTSSSVFRRLGNSGLGYRTLTDWQATGYDAHSVSVMPPFRQPYLHIDSTSGVAKSLNWHATPLAAVTHDFDGQPRDAATPDIGADEFSFQKDTVTIWKKDPLNPILTGGASGSWNRHVFMPCVLYNADSSRYEMWFGASFGPGTPNWRPYRIGFAISKDGSSWTMHPSPVLSPDPGTWEAYTVEQPKVIRENGFYKMWYTGSPDWNNSMIGYATSPDGIHWTKYASNPVMGVGKASWDAGGPYSCTVMPFQGGYRMWYGAYSSINPYPGCIGYATSPDGVTWQRDTVHNPVVKNGASYEWDGYFAITPQVLQLGDTYWMWYTGTASGNGIRCGGEASSNDMGITWNKRPDNPVLMPSNAGWDATYIEVGTVLRKGKDSLELWYAGAAAPSYTWAIGRATAIFTGIAREVREVPQNFLLSQNYPNPFNPTTAINYEVSLSSFVTLKVYDILGREVATLVNEKKSPGNYTVRFNAAGLASGVYLYRVTAGNFAQTKKMMVVK